MQTLRFGRAVFIVALAMLSAPFAFAPAQFAVAQNAQADSAEIVRLPVEPLTVQLAGGKALTFQAEIADSDDERSRGLMFRRSMAEREAMLFIWPEPIEAAMWMRNTYISLDMLFVDETGSIVYIARRTQPHSLKVISAGKQVKAVLEIAGGAAAKLNIAVGDRLAHRIFRAP